MNFTKVYLYLQKSWIDPFSVNVIQIYQHFQVRNCFNFGSFNHLFPQLYSSLIISHIPFILLHRWHKSYPLFQCNQNEHCSKVAWRMGLLCIFVLVLSSLITIKITPHSPTWPLLGQNDWVEMGMYTNQGLMESSNCLFLSYCWLKCYLIKW